MGSPSLVANREEGRKERDVGRRRTKGLITPKGEGADEPGKGRPGGPREKELGSSRKE